MEPLGMGFMRVQLTADAITYTSTSSFPATLLSSPLLLPAPI